MQIKPFYIDKYPVTNAEFKKLSMPRQYRPQDSLNFLKIGKTRLSRWLAQALHGLAEDAREYAKWAGKRLPSRVGVAIAKQGNDAESSPGRLRLACAPPSGGKICCPWQNDPQSTPAPVPDKGRVMVPPAMWALIQRSQRLRRDDMIGNVCSDR